MNPQEPFYLSSVPVVLASASPRRQELLKEVVPVFTISPADADETIFDGETPLEAAKRLAILKARAVARNFEDSIVIGGDTIVTVDGQMLGKPEDTENAARMLQLLSGRSHSVITALALAYQDRVVVGATVTQVWFRAISSTAIHAYVATGEPADKAGGYGIQGGAASFVERIDGPIDAVIGFPRELCRQLFAQLGETKKTGYEM